MSTTTIREHDERLAAAGLPSVRTLTNRALRIFDSASAAQVEAGLKWYDEASALALTLSAYLGGDVEQAAEVIAALSPRTFWSRNVAGAVALVIDGTALPGLIGRNVDMARRIIDGEENVLRGPKTRAFAANIAGDRTRVTVDVHAAWAVGVDPDLLGRKGVYEAVEAAYQRAALQRAVDPATAQAVVWVVHRAQRLSDQRRNR